MAKRNQIIGKKTKKWEPQVLPNATKSKKQIENIKNKFLKNNKHNLLLENWGKNVGLKRDRKRPIKPELWKNLESKKFWDEKPSAPILALKEFSRAKKYYESDRIKSVLSEMKELNPDIKLPTEMNSYNAIKLYLETKQKPAGGDNELAMLYRRFFSTQSSPEEFELRIKTQVDEKNLIKNIYNKSSYKNKISFENYEKNFYSIMREMMSKSKTRFSSDTVRTALLDNGVDNAIEQNGELSEDLVNKLLESIDEKQSDIIQLNAKLFGGMDKINKIKDQSITRIRLPKDSRIKEIINNPDSLWFDDLVEREDQNKILISDKFNNTERAEISTLFRTVGELKNAQNIMKRARQKMIDKKPYSVDFYEKASEIIKNNTNLSNDALAEKLAYRLDNSDFIEAILLDRKGDLL